MANEINVLLSLQDQFSKTFQAVGRNFDSTVSKMKNVGSQLNTKLTLPIVGVGLAAIKSGADLETLRTSFVSLTGGVEQAADMMDNLNEFTAKTPFQLEQVASSAKQLIASGTKIEDVNDQLQFLGDIAATSGSNIDEIASIFSKVNAKGKVELDALNSLAERGIPIFTALSEATGLPAEKLGGGAVSVEQFNSVLQSFSEEGGLAAGAMERLSETAAGKFSTAMDNLKLAGAALAESLLPIINQILDGVTWMAQAFANLSPEMQKTILIVAGVVAAIGPMITVITSVVTGIQAIGAALTFLAANPVGIVIVAVGALVAALIWLYNNQELVAQKLAAAWEWIRNLFWEKVNNVTDIITNGFTSIDGFLNMVWEGIKLMFDTIWLSIFGVFEFYAWALWELLVLAFEQVGVDLEAIWQGIKDYFFGVWEAILAKFNAVWNAIASAVTSIMARIKSTFTSVWNGIKALLTTVWNTLKDIVKGGLEGIYNLIVGSKDMVVDGFNSIWSGVTGVTTSAFNTLKGMVTRLVNWIISKINAVINAINGATSAVAEVVGGSGESVRIPTIPALAKGGIVTKPTLALIGEAGPEAVVPLSGPNAGKGPGGVTVIVQGNTLLDEDAGEKIGNQIIRELAFNNQF